MRRRCRSGTASWRRATCVGGVQARRQSPASAREPPGRRAAAAGGMPEGGPLGCGSRVASRRHGAAAHPSEAERASDRSLSADPGCVGDVSGGASVESSCSELRSIAVYAWLASCGVPGTRQTRASGQQLPAAAAARVGGRATRRAQPRRARASRAEPLGVAQLAALPSSSRRAAPSECARDGMKRSLYTTREGLPSAPAMAELHSAAQRMPRSGDVLQRRRARRHDTPRHAHHAQRSGTGASRTERPGRGGSSRQLTSLARLRSQCWRRRPCRLRAARRRRRRALRAGRRGRRPPPVPACCRADGGRRAYAAARRLRWRVRSRG